MLQLLLNLLLDKEHLLKLKLGSSYVQLVPTLEGITLRVLQPEAKGGMPRKEKEGIHHTKGSRAKRKRNSNDLL